MNRTEKIKLLEGLSKGLLNHTVLNEDLTLILTSFSDDPDLYFDEMTGDRYTGDEINELKKSASGRSIFFMTTMGREQKAGEYETVK